MPASGIIAKLRVGVPFDSYVIRLRFDVLF